MIHVVIGHRGTGKTSFGKRILFYHPEAVVLDLDEVISQREQVTIEHIFKEQGEDVFRQLEQKYFSELMAEYHGSRHEIYLVVGGGFEVDRIPKNIPILFIKRSSDSQGRIFLNRVRLQPELTPLEEYFMRYEIRETKFLACHSVCYEVPEGLSEYFKEIELNIEQRDSSLVLKVEKTILDQSFETDFCYTLHPQDVSVPLRMELICQMVSRGNVGVLELRDDLLSKTQIFDVIRKLPDKKILLSLRRTDSAELLEQIVLLPGVRLWGLDCDKQYWSQQILEIATGDFLKIISSHDASLPSFEVPNGWIMKWSPLISDWAGLGEGLFWKVQNPSAIFLPRSEEGRWTWLRLLLSRRQPLNFLRLSHASASDQPSLFETLLHQKLKSSRTIAGVLGFPVLQSFSPIFHADAFARRDIPYFRIAIRESEWKESMNFFDRFRDLFDIRMASVTSPLKKIAAQTSKKSEGLSACNTLTMKDGESIYLGENTDQHGFFKAFQDHLKGHILLWGGGGMVEAVQRACEKAGVLSFTHLSSRRPEYKGFDFDRPYTVIWAAPSSDLTQYPNKEIEIVKILDLNYFESSFGRNQALAKKNEYHSGYKMFVEQAKKQQEIWSLR